jgi:hypothetical protein
LAEQDEKEDDHLRSYAREETDKDIKGMLRTLEFNEQVEILESPFCGDFT